MSRAGTLLAALALALAAAPAASRAQAPADAAAWRAVQPKPAGAITFRSPRVQKLKLQNGIPVWLVERHGLPLLTVTAIVRAGSERSTAQTAGLPNLVNRMLVEGTTTRGPIAIAEESDALGARLGRYTGMDVSLVAMDILAEALDASLDLFADVVLRPAFAPPELERVRHELLADVLQLKDEPARMSVQLAETVLYGPQHPYGMPIRGTESSLKRLARADVAAFYQAHYVAPNAMLLVVGDTTPQAILAKLEARFGAWPGGTPQPVTLPQPPAVAGPVIYLLDRPRAPQAFVRFAALGLARRDPAFEVGELANEVFGGAFSSRLNMNLREQQGYTYGAHAYLVGRRTPGPFTGGAAVKTAVTADAIRELLAELDGMRTRPPTAAELDEARGRMLLSLAGHFETTGRTARTLDTLMVHGFAPTYYDGLGARLRRLGPKAIARFAPRLYDARRLVFAVIGPRRELEADLAKVGTVTVVDQATLDRLFP
ncbi:MAG TPA: pitrilysin family protein [Polyangia bacterium]|jgi:zinc protease